MNIGIENNLGFDIQSVILVLISTLLIIFIAKKYFWDAILQYFDNRRAYLDSEYQKATDALEQGNVYKKQYETQLKDARNQADAIVENAKLQANEEYNKVMDKAKTDSHLMMEKAKSSIDYERRQAEETINDRIKEVAFSAAEKLIKQEISEQTKRDYVDAFIEDINE